MVNITISTEFLIDQSQKPRWYYVRSNWKQICFWPNQYYTTTQLAKLISKKSNIEFKSLRYITRYTQKDGLTRFQIFLPHVDFYQRLRKIQHIFPTDKVREHIENRTTAIPKPIIPQNPENQTIPLNILSWNCNGISRPEKRISLQHLIATNDTCVVNLQETLRDTTSHPLFELQGWAIFEQPWLHTRHHRGVLTAINLKAPQLAGWEARRVLTADIQETTIFVKLTPPRGSKCPPIIIGNIYGAAPSSLKKSNHKNIVKTIREVHNSNQNSELVIVGDFNMHTEDITILMDPFYRFLRFCPITAGEKHTRYPNKIGMASTIDHVFAHPNLQVHTTNTGTSTSDHCPIIASAKITDAPTCAVNPRMVPAKVISKFKLVRNYNMFSPLFQLNNADDIAKGFTKAAHKCASELKLWSNASDLKRKSPLSQSSRDLLKRRKRATLRLQRDKSDQNAKALREITKDMYQSFRNDRMINSLNSINHQTDQLLSNGHVVDAWKHTLRSFEVGKNQNKGSPNRKTFIADPNNKDAPLDTSTEAQAELWTQHFQGVLGEQSVQDHPKTEAEWNLKMDNKNLVEEIDNKFDFQPKPDTSPFYGKSEDPVDPKINKPIKWKEIARHIRKLGERKTPGEDGVIAEIFKSEIMNDETPYNFRATEPISDVGRSIKRLIECIWETEKVPEEYKTSIIAPIPKIPDPVFASDFRPISLIPVAMKLITSILAERILITYNNRISPQQAGFRSKEECIGQIISLHETIRNSQLKGKDTYVCFIDFQQAFDSVPHFPMMKAISDFGIRGKMFNLIKDIYTDSKCKVRLNDGKLTLEIPIKRGVKQGDPLSPILFIIFIDSLSKLIQSRCLGVNLGKGLNLSNLLYADDVSLCTHSTRKLQHILDLTSLWLDTYNMKANPKKCGIMVFRAIGKKATRTNQTFYIQQQQIPQVETYKYLGIDFDRNLSYVTMANTRIQKAEKILNICSRKFGSNFYPLRTKIMILKSIIIPTLTYGCQLWGYDPEAKQGANRILQKAVNLIAGQNQSKRATAMFMGIKSIEEIVRNYSIDLFMRSTDKNTWFNGIIQRMCRQKNEVENQEVFLWSRQIMIEIGEIVSFDLDMNHPPMTQLEHGEAIKEKWNEIFPRDKSNTDPTKAHKLLDIMEDYTTRERIKEIQKSKRAKTGIINDDNTLQQNIKNLQKTLKKMKSLRNDYYILTTGIKSVINIMTGNYWTGHRNFLVQKSKLPNDTNHEETRHYKCIHCKSDHCETTTHILRDCPAWSRARKLIWKKACLSDSHTETLLKVLHKDSIIQNNQINESKQMARMPQPTHKKTPYEKMIQTIATQKDELVKIACFFQLINHIRSNQRRIDLRPPDQKSQRSQKPSTNGRRKITEYFKPALVRSLAGVIEID